MPPFELPVRLRVVPRRSHVGHAREADELLEVSRDELRAVVRDDPRTSLGVLLPRALNDALHVELGLAGRPRMAPDHAAGTRSYLGDVPQTPVPPHSAPAFVTRRPRDSIIEPRPMGPNLLRDQHVKPPHVLPPLLFVDMAPHDTPP